MYRFCIFLTGFIATLFHLASASGQQDVSEDLRGERIIKATLSKGEVGRYVDTITKSSDSDVIVSSDFQTISADEKGMSEDKTSQSFLTSNGVPFPVKDHFPAFSWDKVPVYMMFAHGDRLLEPSEVSKIALESRFVTIEKEHGRKALGGAELGLKHETTAFKKENGNIKVLGYTNAAIAYPFSKYTKAFAKELPLDSPIRQYLLTDPKTGELYRKEGTAFWCYDVTNPNMRKWWSDSAADLMVQARADGIFVDQLHGLARVHPKESRGNVQKNVTEMLQQLKNKIGPEKILLANNGAGIESIFPIADAFMFEHYSFEATHTKEKLLRDWQLMEKIADAGKLCVYRFSAKPEPGTALHSTNARRHRLHTHNKEFAELSKDQLPYYLGAYLIGAQPGSYFQWGWGWGLTTGPLEHYPEFHKPLGKPLGKFKRVDPEKWEFTREFEHLKVWVDTENRTAKLQWKE